MLAVRRSLATLLLLAVGALAASACSDDGAAGPGGRVSVVATTTQLGDFARVVGGESVSVTTLLGADSDPHDYEPTPSDVAAVADADLVVSNGLGLDDWIAGVVDAAGDEPLTVEAGRSARTAPGGEESAPDPHVWLDPDNTIAMVRAVRDGLQAADPEGAAGYAGRAETYAAQVRALDARLKDRIAGVPAAARKIVTTHDELGYFARRYGIRVVGAVVPSLDSGAEPSARDLARLVDLIRREGVKVVFTEATRDGSLEREVAREAGARVVADLYVDALGPPGSGAETWLGMMEANMETIAGALSAP